MFSLVEGECVWKDRIGSKGGDIGHSHGMEHSGSYMLLLGDF